MEANEYTLRQITIYYSFSLVNTRNARIIFLAVHLKLTIEFS